jgi:hypothetical protein
MEKVTITNSIRNKIHTLRGIQVILDKDLAELYEVKSFRLKEQVKRNIERFPERFMFQLTFSEAEEIMSKKVDLKDLSQSAIPFKKLLGGSLPYVFTEQGVAMLSGILRSKKAIEVSINIMEAFVAMRKFISRNTGLFMRLDNVDKKLIEHDDNFKEVFDALEMKKPKQGIFFDGQIFDAYKFVCDLIKNANSSIILIDNYVDETILSLFSDKNKDVKVNIYTKKITNKLKLSIEKFNSQYKNLSVKEFDKSHYRFLIIDEEIYHFGASLKDLGKKWFAFSKLNKDYCKILDKLK